MKRQEKILKILLTKNQSLYENLFDNIFLILTLITSNTL